MHGDEYRPMIGIGKILIPAYTHRVKMKIEETTMDATVSFADSAEAARLLGKTDIFKELKITFDEQDLESFSRHGAKQARASITWL